ncbi:MAG TPA: serine hydrolase domain-containing protein [Rhizomicrobium sp.]|jgi:CubicO group peptidase (beta-lactamase class C family)|nr:serine hydrolase domain-containing protein [Rhizomicrobium sp.]
MRLVFAALLAMASASPASADEFDGIADRALAARHVPGAAIAVVKDGRVAREKVAGSAELELGVPVTAATLFQLASITKLFTGVALGRLEQEGKLDLDEPVGRYLSGLPESWNGATLRELAAHISGLPDLVSDPDRPLSDEELGRSADEALAIAAKKPLPSAPGTGFLYDQTGYLLLSRVIEKVSGRPFRDAVRELVLVPAGMRRTDWADARRIVAGRAAMYSSFGRKQVENALLFTYGSYFDAAAGLNTDIGDMEKFAAALETGVLLTPRERQRLWGPTRFRDGKTADIAQTMGASGVLSPNVGGFYAAEPKGKHPREWMEGGATASFFYYPRENLAVIVLTNLQGARPGGLAEKIAGLYIPGLEPVFGR